MLGGEQAARKILLRNRYRHGIARQPLHPQRALLASQFLCRKEHCLPSGADRELVQDNHDDVDFLASPEGKAKIVELHRTCIAKHFGL